MQVPDHIYPRRLLADIADLLRTEIERMQKAAEAQMYLLRKEVLSLLALPALLLQMSHRHRKDVESDGGADDFVAERRFRMSCYYVSHYYTCLILLSVSSYILLYMCPHATICVLILLYMCTGSKRAATRLTYC